MDQGGPCAAYPEAVVPSLGGDSSSDRKDGDTRVQASGEQVVNPLLPILRGAPAHVVQALPPVWNFPGGHRHNVDTRPIKGNPRGKSLQGGGAPCLRPSRPDRKGGVIHRSSGEGVRAARDRNLPLRPEAGQELRGSRDAVKPKGGSVCQLIKEITCWQHTSELVEGLPRCGAEGPGNYQDLSCWV